MAKAKELSPEEAAKVRAEWNIGEWDKPEQYKYVEVLKGDYLRWEFLRREEDYRKKYAKDPKSTHFLLGKYLSPNIRGDELPIDFCFQDTARRGEPLILTPPSVKTLLFTREEGSADSKIRAHYGFKLEELYDLDYAVMVFDPMRAPSSQINNVRKILNDLHKQYVESLPEKTIKGKRNPKDATKLLRALDAASVGIANKGIASDIIGTEGYDNQKSTGQERLKAARMYWRVM
jgi:hypothetical protein